MCQKLVATCYLQCARTGLDFGLRGSVMDIVSELAGCMIGGRKRTREVLIGGPFKKQPQTLMREEELQNFAPHQINIDSIPKGVCHQTLLFSSCTES